MIGRTRVGVAATLLAGLALLSAPAADPPAGAGEPVVVVDSAGKEIRLAKVKVTAGTRRLGWLADPKGDADARKGPLALEVREPSSTTYAKGVVTLVPLAGVESVRYEVGKSLVGVKGRAEPVVGTTEYKGFNVIGLEGDAGGVSAKFSGGVTKAGIKSMTFPAARPLPERKADGPSGSVRIDRPKAGNPPLTVRNLKALYTFPGGVEQLADALPVRKGEPLKLDGTLRRLEVLAVDANAHAAAAEVQAGDGPERTVVLPLTRDQDGRTGTLVGLLGEVDVGWKLFPLHTVKAVSPAGP